MGLVIRTVDKICLAETGRRTSIEAISRFSGLSTRRPLTLDIN